VSINVVPVIYDHTTKKILRWYLLDYDYQLNDLAYKPTNLNEREFKLPIQLYRILVGMDDSKPLLHKLQAYINSSAP
jgi:hypothetical protein